MLKVCNQLHDDCIYIENGPRKSKGFLVSNELTATAHKKSHCSNTSFGTSNLLLALVPFLAQCRFGSHLCEKQERNVVKKYVLLKQRRTGKICANLLPQKSKQFVTKWQWLNSTRKCGNFSPRVFFARYTFILQIDGLLFVRF